MWIKPQAAARMLSMHPDTLARKVDSGELAITVRKSESGHRTYARADVERLATGSTAFSHPLIEEFAQAIANELSDMGLLVPLADVDTLYAQRWDILGELKAWGPDSGTREAICDHVSRLLTGRSVPMIGEGDRVFHIWNQKLQTAAVEKGWQICGKIEDPLTDWTTHPLPEGESESVWQVSPLARGRSGPLRFAKLFVLGKLGLVSKDDYETQRRPLLMPHTAHAMIIAQSDRTPIWQKWQREHPDGHLVRLEASSRDEQQCLLMDKADQVAPSLAVLVTCDTSYSFMYGIENGRGEWQLLTQWGEIPVPLPIFADESDPFAARSMVVLPAGLDESTRDYFGSP
jgi:hypothetical protein